MWWLIKTTVKLALVAVGLVWLLSEPQVIIVAGRLTGRASAVAIEIRKLVMSYFDDVSRRDLSANVDELIKPKPGPTEDPKKVARATGRGGLTGLNKLKKPHRNKVAGNWKKAGSGSFTGRELPSGTPCDGVTTSTFGLRSDPFSGYPEMHSGVDIATELGSPVIATAKGQVVFAGTKGDYGNCVVLDHGASIRTLYGHLDRFAVTESEVVEKGSVIAYSGDTGRSTGPHLHYEVLIDGTAVDPEGYMSGAGTIQEALVGETGGESTANQPEGVN